MQTICELYNVEIDRVKEHIFGDSDYGGCAVDTLIGRLSGAGIYRIRDAVTALKTPKRFDRLLRETNVPIGFLSELRKHCDVYYPTPVPLGKLDIFQPVPDGIGFDDITSKDLFRITFHLQFVNTGKITSYNEYLCAFGSLGTHTHHDILVNGKTTEERKDLAARVGLPYEDLLEIVRYCDYWRMGRRLNAMRPRIYYYMQRASEMGKLGKIDTVESRVEMMAEYVSKNNLYYVKLITSTKETGGNENQSIQAKYHSDRFQIEYD